MFNNLLAEHILISPTVLIYRGSRNLKITPAQKLRENFLSRGDSGFPVRTSISNVFRPKSRHIENPSA